MMLKEQQSSAISQKLEEICHNIKINHFNNAYNLCSILSKQITNEFSVQFSHHLLLNCYSRKQVEASLQLLEIESLKSYCLINLAQYDEARQILMKCLKICPNHAPSQRRLASLNEKEGDFQEALNILAIRALFEPDNVHLSNSIMKLTKKVKCFSTVSSIEKIEYQSVSKTTFEEEAYSQNKQHVTFGTSEIIQITSDQSDEYLAHIKQEINKLNEKKPKKSILKGSKINKDNMSNLTYTNSEEEKIELDQIVVKKTFSMKSCSNESPLKWQSDSLQDEKLISSSKKQKKKKKCVSFSVGKDNQEDKQ